MYAVIDTETTGLNLTSDRIIELAVIGLDSDGNKEWEWCSLINPERNTGSGLAIRVHQIYPRDVAAAPKFAEVAGHIADILHGRALIAHNARFDLGMLRAEFSRLGVSLPSVTQICTANMARDCGFKPWALEECCATLGIELEGVHHALADARATWRLIQKLFDFSHDGMRKDVLARLRAEDPWPTLPVVSRGPITRPMLPYRKLVERSIGGCGGTKKAAQAVIAENSVPVIENFSIDLETPESKYLAAVERVLEDREISPEQQQTLAALRSELELTDDKVRDVHLTFIRGLAGNMWTDGQVSKHEQFDFDVVGKMLKLSEEDLKYALRNPILLELINMDNKPLPGARVVFTGEMSISRTEWTSRAQAAGLRVTAAVSGKTDYLIVPFGETGSSKSLKARALGVRVISEQRFLRMISSVSDSVAD